MPLSPSIDGVAIALSQDATILGFKGLNPQSPIDNIAQYILKTEETDEIVTAQTIPLILIYNRPGKSDVNSVQMYVDKIVIDMFAASDYTARSMADRAFDLLHTSTLPSPTFQVSRCRYAYGSSFKTGITGVKGYRLWFDVEFYIG